MQPVQLTGFEYALLLAVMITLTGAIAWCIKWGVETLVESLGTLTKELHKLAERVVSLEEWRRFTTGGGRRHDDPPVD